MATRIYELRNPSGFDLDEIKALFDAAFEENHPANADVVRATFKAECQNPSVYVLVGQEGAELKSLLIGIMPTSVLYPQPTVYIFYNGGTRTLAKATIDAGLARLRENGYNRVVATNWTGKDDEVWRRAFSRGGMVVKTASLFEITLAEPEED